MRQQVRGIAQEFHEFFLTDPGSMNPFEATLTVEYEAALNAGRARAVTHEAAILVDVEHDVLGRESEHCYRCLVLLHTLEANIGLVGAVARYTVIGDPAAELARQLLDPAIGEGDFPPPDERGAIDRGARVIGLRKIRVVLGAGSVARWRDGIAW